MNRDRSTGGPDNARKINTQTYKVETDTTQKEHKRQHIPSNTVWILTTNPSRKRFASRRPPVKLRCTPPTPPFHATSGSSKSSRACRRATLGAGSAGSAVAGGGGG